MNLNRGILRELFRNSLLRSRPTLTSGQQEPEVSQVTGSTPWNLLPRDARRGWRGIIDSHHQKVISICCSVSCPGIAGGHPASLSYMKAGTGHSMCRGSKTIPHEGRHVVRGLCQPEETVLPLRDTKSHCPCLFFSSSKTVRVQNSLQR